MALKIVCSGHLIRYPVGGFSPHHLQYLLGFQRLGAEVVYFENFGWSQSCYDFRFNAMTDDPACGLEYWQALMAEVGATLPWCYLAADGQSYGMSRDELADACRECDVYFNLSNINWIPELWACRRRVLIDTDPVFTQIKAHGLGGSFERYQAHFTFGMNVHSPDCSMPTAGVRWLPTRQPVVLDLWPVVPGPAGAPFTTLMNWSAYGEHRHAGQTYGQKDREFAAYFDFPAQSGQNLEVAVNVPDIVRQRLVKGGWRVTDPREPSASLERFRAYLQASAGEFAVAKHGYVVSRSGWFGDRSACYLASGRPVILQDTGYSAVLPCGKGLLAFSNPDEAAAALSAVRERYEEHSRAARTIAEEYFDARRVLTDLLEAGLSARPAPPEQGGGP